MTLIEFDILQKDEKARFVRGCEVIGVRSEGCVKVFLHQTPFFYVEVYFDTEQRQIICFNAFYDTEYLEPYLEQIDISVLF